MTEGSLKKRIMKASLVSTSFITIIICLFHTWLAKLEMHQLNKMISFVILYILSLVIILLQTNKIFDYFLLPLQEIQRGIHELQMGNMGYRINIHTNDELQEIGDMLNNTAQIMQENQIASEQNLQREKRQKENLFKVYSDVIASVTQGKFNLVEQHRFELLSDQGELWGKVLLQEPQDINRARLLVALALHERQYSIPNLMHVKLCVSEAATNALKHAGAGKLIIKKVANRLRIIITDQGPGMDYDRLSRMIFFQGFSTKISMGFGFNLMYKYADQITLSTSAEGTCLMLDFLIDSYH